MLGENRVIVEKQEGQGSTFVHLHADEQTALQAARAVIAQAGGTLVRLVHSGGRLVTFRLHGADYRFDPNRIFSDRGIRLTLGQYSRYTPQAHREVEKLAKTILAALPATGKIIAVHNNRSFSLRDYFPGNPSASEAEAVHHNPQAWYRNFCLVTRQQDFERLRRLGFNSVLQTARPRDDGSLSVRFADGHYINVEAGHDQLAQQIDMLRTV